MAKPWFGDTTLIIGAGAHVPYNFPTGNKLVEDMKMMHRNYPRVDIDSTMYNKIDAAQRRIGEYSKEAVRMQLIPDNSGGGAINSYEVYLQKKMEDLIESFGRSRSSSIDAFLAKYINEHEDSEDFAKVGKFLIASIILDYEERYPVAFLKNDWIDFIINNYLRDKSTHDEFFLNPPKIITFNYDNLLERMLLDHLMHFHNEDRATAIAKIKKLNIHHVYGDIGSFEREKRQDILKYSLSSLKVIGEERNNISKYQEEITNLIGETEYVYFFGFGFDLLNMDVLSFKKVSMWERFKDIQATSIGINQFMLKNVEKKARFDIDFSVGQVERDTMSLISEKTTIFEYDE